MGKNSEKKIKIPSQKERITIINRLKFFDEPEREEKVRESYNKHLSDFKTAIKNGSEDGAKREQLFIGEIDWQYRDKYSWLPSSKHQEPQKETQRDHSKDNATESNLESNSSIIEDS